MMLRCVVCTYVIISMSKRLPIESIMKQIVSVPLTSNSPNNIAHTNVRLANINRLPPNAPRLTGVIRCTFPAQHA